MKINSKFVYLTLITSVALTFSACSGEKSQDISISYPDSSLPVSTGETPKPQEDVDVNTDDGFEFSAALNIFLDKNGALVPVENKLDIANEQQVSLTLQSFVATDKTQAQTDIPLRVYLLADGKPIDFSLDESKTYSAVNDVKVNANQEIYHTLYFDAKPDMKYISIMYVYFPLNIPQQGLGSYGGELLYTMYNSASDSLDGEVSSEIGTYVEVRQLQANYGIDVGSLTIEENNNMVVENHFYEDVVLTSENSNLYVKFNSGEASDMCYYLCLLLDGELIPAFNGEYSTVVNCLSGQRSFQYKISPELIPENGLHTFQAVALPSFNADDFNSFGTSKIRVNVN